MESFCGTGAAQNGPGKIKKGEAHSVADTEKAEIVGSKSGPRTTAVALGYFDGVHLGHRKILRAAAAYAVANGCRSVAFTFTFGQARTKGDDLLTISQRHSRLLAEGMDSVCCLPFDEISGMSPQTFVREILQGKLNAVAVFCGENFRFGAGAAGDIALLQLLCKKEGIAVYPFGLLSDEGGSINATRLRGLLAEGELEEVNRLLTQPYAIDLPVVHGQQLGSTVLGFPTINQLFPPHMQQPRQGVYLTSAVIDGVEYPSATGLGSRPTVGGQGVTCETFICRFHKGLYGTTPCVRFWKYLWPTQKYASVEELKQCIEDAARQSAAFFDERMARQNQTGQAER